jgi:hypothetical protein
MGTCFRDLFQFNRQRATAVAGNDVIGSSMFQRTTSLTNSFLWVCCHLRYIWSLFNHLSLHIRSFAQCIQTNCPRECFNSALQRWKLQLSHQLQFEIPCNYSSCCGDVRCRHYCMLVVYNTNLRVSFQPPVQPTISLGKSLYPSQLQY